MTAPFPFGNFPKNYQFLKRQPSLTLHIKVSDSGSGGDVGEDTQRGKVAAAVEKKEQGEKQVVMMFLVVMVVFVVILLLAMLFSSRSRSL